jgi:flavin-dependent thymidylate synthase
MAGNQVQKWADDFMFKAEESKASEGPKAFLLQGTPDPLGSIAAMAKMYKGEVVRNKATDVTDDERRYYLAEMQKTKLKAPLEAVTLHWMIEGVTRSYTHQMVRQRTAVYAQESLRFAVKEDAADAVALPPSLAGTEGGWDVHESRFEADRMSEPEKMRMEWDTAVDVVSEAYNRLVNMGMPAEDARGLLPHNITTRLNYVTNLRNYQDHAGNRLCTQAQFEWRIVWVRMLEAMADYCTMGCLAEHDTHSPFCDNWQWKAISLLFRPVCYYTGQCQFMADFDRKCSIRDRVQANATVGRPSSEWDKPTFEKSHEGQKFGSNGEVFIGAIHPAEWLLDAGAAR